MAILHVEKHVTGFVEGGVLRSATEVFTRGGDFSRLGIDGRYTLGARSAVNTR